MLALLGLLVGLGAGAAARRLPALGEAPTDRELWVGATASALAACFADAALTGWVVLDVPARAALGAACVFLAARAGLPPVLLTAASGAAVAVGSPLRPLACAVAGFVVVATLTWRHAPRVTAAAAGIMVQVALHLDRPVAAGATTVAAALILFPAVAAGVAKLPSSTRRRWLRPVVPIVVASAALGALGLGSALLARRSLERGLTAVRGSLAVQQVDRSGVVARLDEAEVAFSDARGDLLSWWARPAWIVPVVGQNLRALRAAALEGQRLVASGKSLTAASLDEIRPEDGRISLEAVRAATEPIVEAAEDVSRAHSRLRAVRKAWLLPPLRGRLDRALGELAVADTAADRARRVLTHLPSLLGGDGLRRYFVVVQTAAELRASGGFLGNFAEITADQGQLTLVRVGRTVDLNVGSDPRSRRLVAPADYVSRYGRFAPERFWQNVNVSPDFPTDATVIADLYPQSGGEAVDGVLAVDPKGLATLLRLTGPVQVPDWPEPLTAENAEPVLLHEHYVAFAGRETERTDFLGSVASEVWNRLAAGPLPGAYEILSTLAPAARGKHLMITSVRPDQEQLFEDLGVAGKMAPVRSDFLAVVTQAAGANKIDYFLRRRFDYEATLDVESGDVRAELTVVLQNLAPRSGLPALVIGNEARPPIPVGDNKVYLSVYSPWAMEEARVDDQTVPFETEAELGRRVYSRFVVIPSEASVTVRLRLAGRLRVGDDYRLDVHRQPAVAPDEVSTSLTLHPGGRPAPLRPGSAETFLLGEDRFVEWALDG